MERHALIDEPSVRGAALLLACGGLAACGAPAPTLTLDPLPAEATTLVLIATGRSDAPLVRADGGLAPLTVPVTADGRWRLPLGLEPSGQTRFTFVGQDVDGTPLTEPLALTVRYTPPAGLAPPADTSAPAAPLVGYDSLATSASAVNLHGTAEPGAWLTITGGREELTAPVDASGAFSCWVKLRLGCTNDLWLSAQDASGNRGPATHLQVLQEIERDYDGPALPGPTVDGLGAQPLVAAGAQITLHGGCGEPGLRLEVTGGAYPAAGSCADDGRYALGVGLEPDRTQTLSLVARRADGAASEPLAFAVTAGTNGHTRHPIVLVHGFWGWDKYLGLYPYFFGIVEHLARHGFTAFTPATHPMESIAERAARLGRFVDQLTSGPVHLVGHSMGGLDSRQLAAWPAFQGRVLSVTTVATPHRGQGLVDIALGLTPGPAEAALDFLLNVAGWDLAGLSDLSVAHVTGTFNPATPDTPGVVYQSYGGRADPIGWNGGVLSPYFWASWAMLAALEGPNDGLVSVTSASWGQDLGTLPADHLDEIGQFWGADGAGFDAQDFFLELAWSLAALEASR